MNFALTPLEGVWLVEPEPHRDHRGHFVRTFCKKEFSARGLNTDWVQENRSHSLVAGTLRGLHWQDEPHEEERLVSCLAGVIWDVVVDMRPGSPTFGRWAAFELSPENLRRIYIPKGFAHGFQCLTDGCDVHYLVSQYHAPGSERGLRWNDPSLGIAWPIQDPILSERDRNLPLLK